MQLTLKHIFTILLLLIYSFSFSQDLIILNTGDEIKAKVLGYDQSYLRYRVFDDLSGKIQSLSKNDVSLIKYDDGTSISFGEKTVKQNDTTIVSYSNEQIEEIAKNDANIYYDPTSPILFAGCASFCFPGIGVFTALVPPSGENLKIPVEYASNKEYINYYTQEATFIKQKNVLIATGVTTTLSLLFWITLISLM